MTEQPKAQEAHAAPPVTPGEAPGAVTPDRKELCERVDGYLQLGALFNPEAANHDAVRDLIIDLRDALVSREGAASVSPKPLKDRVWAWAINNKTADGLGLHDGNFTIHAQEALRWIREFVEADQKSVPQDAAPRVSPQGQDAPLSCKVEGECLVIEIGIRTLAHAASYSEWANRYDEARADYRRSFAIIDLHEYAKDVALQMQHEAEDGSSLLTKLIDEAMEAAVDDGSMGTDDADVAFEQFAPSETWAGAVPSPAPQKEHED